MSVNYNDPVNNSRLQDVASAIDAGGSNGVLRLLDGGAVLSSLSLARPCGTVANGVLTFSGMSLIDPSAAATGFASAARIEASDGTVIVFGLSVGGVGSTADISLSPGNAIQAGQTVAITQASISKPPVS